MWYSKWVEVVQNRAMVFLKNDRLVTNTFPKRISPIMNDTYQVLSKLDEKNEEKVFQRNLS